MDDTQLGMEELGFGHGWSVEMNSEWTLLVFGHGCFGVRTQLAMDVISAGHRCFGDYTQLGMDVTCEGLAWMLGDGK